MSKYGHFAGDLSLEGDFVKLVILSTWFIHFPRESWENIDKDRCGFKG